MSHDNSNPNDLQPRAQRRRKKNSNERGLASNADLRALARAYLVTQNQLWPELVKNGVLPPLTEDAIDLMVTGFRKRHMNGQLDLCQQLDKYIGHWIFLALVYARYSCDNSKPTSIIDQMNLALRKAKSEQRFVPWEFVFADYSVSGLENQRRGYQNCKSLIRHSERRIDTTYMDDFTRMSRDSQEALKLAYFCLRRSIRLIGASDGFDLSSRDWDLRVTFSGLQNRQFLRNLQEKVGRGMRGAAERGTCLGKPPMGFTRRKVCDSEGNPIVQSNGKLLFNLAIDPVSRVIVEQLFELFVSKRMSAYKIARQFNQQAIDGTDTWTESCIKQMLNNEAYIGKFIWNRTRREYDEENEKWTIVPNPQEKWIVREDASLAIIPVEQWQAAQSLLAALKRNPGSKKAASRNQVRATTLFSGTLFCGYCEHELLLYRSAGDYRNMFCVNGRGGIHGCKLCTSKSVRVIEDCLLQLIMDSILTDAAVAELVPKANAHLRSMAARPKTNVSPLKSQIARLQKKNDFLVKRVEDLTISEAGLRETFERQIINHQREIDALRTALEKAELENAPVPRKLSKKTLQKYLPELRAILSQEIPQAAVALRELTGPISIRQETIPGKTRGARWIASFSPNLLAFLRHVMQGKDCPDSLTLEYLYHAIWTTPATVTVPIEDIPRYEQLAPTFKAMRDQGASIQSIAAAHGMTWDQVRMSLRFADTGTRPKWGKKTRVISPRPPITEKYQTHSQEVVRRREQGETFAKIARELDISESTVRRAWDHAHRKQLQDAASSGETPSRGRYRHLSDDTVRQIQRLLKEQTTSVREIAAMCCVSQSTVRREKNCQSNC